MTIYPLIPSPFRVEIISRSKRHINKDLIPFLENIIYNYTNPLDCEQEPHTITNNLTPFNKRTFRLIFILYTL